MLSNNSSSSKQNKDLLAPVSVDMVLADASTPYGVNHHTHGLERVAHLDFQVVYPMERAYAFAILSTAAELVQGGRRFQDGEIAGDILADGVKVKLVEVSEGNRRVLRIIVPDENYALEPTMMDPEFARQYLEEGPLREAPISLEEFSEGLELELAARLREAGILSQIEPEWRKDFAAYAADKTPSATFSDFLMANYEGEERATSTVLSKALVIYDQLMNEKLVELDDRVRNLEKKLGFY
ncbi:MAG: hypothetical protein KDD62_07905 [Bdellovibrionales bacterium]|nr:hypothetical protein [Bdellovibrionales bacterium]